VDSKRIGTGVLQATGVVFAIGVAAINARQSWGHIVHAGTKVGEPSANLLPMAVDGMVLTGAVLSGVDRLRGFRARWWAVSCIWLGSLLTCVFNVASAWERGIWAWAVAVTPAVAMLLVAEAVFHPGERLITKVKQAVQTASAPAPVPAPVVAPVAPPPPPVPPVPPAPPKPRAPRSTPRQRAKTGGPGTGSPRRAKKTEETTTVPPRTEVIDAVIIPSQPSITAGEPPVTDWAAAMAAHE
jgi:hypothetical protein